MDSINDRIDARKRELAERMPGVMREIAQRFEPRRPHFEKQLAELLAANSSKRSKIFKIQKVASDVRDISRPYTACGKGCSNCCYQLVMLSQTEADTIAHNIGRSAVQLPRNYRLPSTEAFDATTPCSFLIDGACSIYENRPLVCRNQVNLDVDALLCSFENLELGNANDRRYTAVPMQDLGPILSAYRQVSGGDVAGDIRDFFPTKI